MPTSRNINRETLVCLAQIDWLCGTSNTVVVRIVVGVGFSTFWLNRNGFMSLTLAAIVVGVGFGTCWFKKISSLEMVEAVLSFSGQKAHCGSVLAP